MKAAKLNRLTKPWLFAVSVLLVASGEVAADGTSLIVDPNAAVEFARLPGDLRFPEGITANPANGDIYVGTFDPGVANALLRYDRTGRLVARKNLGGTPILGLAFNPRDEMVYLASVGDFTGGGSQIQRIAADFDSETVAETVAEIPSVGAPPDRIVVNPDGSQDVITFGNNGVRVPNALAFAHNGDLYVSDSFQGAIFRINRAEQCRDPGPPCSIDTVAHDELLATAGFPPFGANGLALSRNQNVLHIANTGDDRILRLDLRAGGVEVFVESLNGADGVAFDGAGNLWVAANQADHVAALNENGRVVAQLGAFLGVRDDGSAKGLIFPASLAIVGNNIYVTNAALPLRGGDPSEPEIDVTTYTVSRIPIPDSLRR